MNEQVRASLSRYIRESADRAGLRDWDIHLDAEPCDDAADASVYCVRNIRVAHIQVSPDFEKLTPERARHVIAHELAHIHMDADIDFLDDILPGMVGTHAWTPLRAAILALHEQGIDGVAASMREALELWTP